MTLCNRCAAEAVFVDHGPTVGRGWFCKACKDDVPHRDNVFGNLAKDDLETHPGTQMEFPFTDWMSLHADYYLANPVPYYYVPQRKV